MVAVAVGVGVAVVVAVVVVVGVAVGVVVVVAVAVDIMGRPAMKFPYCRTCKKDLSTVDLYVVSNIFTGEFCDTTCVLSMQAGIDRAIKQDKLKRLDGPDDDKYLTTEELGHDN